MEVEADAHPLQLGPEAMRALFLSASAALDWGAGFGYSRTASVRAITETTLLTFRWAR